MNHPQFDEDFLEFESKVHQVMKLLDEMCSAGKSDADTEAKDTAKGFADHINEDNFIVTVRDDRTVINVKKTSLGKPEQERMSKFTFMQQLEEDATKRANVRREREQMAESFRTLGNEAYRKLNFEKAILMYTKAIDHIKDSPILYNNRALAYIKLKNFKRAIMDVDYVLNKLDEKNMNAWLYRAAAYKRLGDEKSFENSIKFAKKHNSKQFEYIDEFAMKVMQV